MLDLTPGFLHGTRFASHRQMEAESFEYIEVFYNRKRQHSTLKYKSPMQYMDDWISAQEKKKTGSINTLCWKTKNRGNLSLQPVPLSV